MDRSRAAAAHRQTYTLGEGEELRFEVKEHATLFVQLLSGKAEVFGTDLAIGQRLTLKGHKAAVFTWYGCTLELAGDGAPVGEATELVYTSADTPMGTYLKVHGVLDNRRTAARQAGGQGPRTIIAGPVDSGKSTLARILVNYAVRSGWAPTLVDLDPGQGGITCPGTIGATPVESVVDAEVGLPCDVPLVFWLGAPSPGDNPDLFRFLVDRLAGLLDTRAHASAEVAAAGMMVNTMGWVDGLGYDLLLHAIQALKADVVLVVNDDRLHSKLRSEYQAAGIDVVKLPASGGVVARPQALRKTARSARVREYFYGPRGEFSPASQTARLVDMRIYRVGGGPKAPNTALPIGATSVADPLRVAPVAITADLVYQVLAVSHAQSPEQLLAVNVAGFIYVTDVNLVAGTVTYLAPCPGQLPGKFLLAGSLRAHFS